MAHEQPTAILWGTGDGKSTARGAHSEGRRGDASRPRGVSAAESWLARGGLGAGVARLAALVGGAALLIVLAWRSGGCTPFPRAIAETRQLLCEIP